jgi:glycine/serine hydroxymethyltransferase
MKEKDMTSIANFINRAISVQHDDEALKAIADEVRTFMKNYPMPQV